MDFSENLTQMHKFERQSSHFNKQQYLLHCTVKHVDNTKSMYEYMYHLSDDLKLDHAFTSAVVNQTTENDSSNIL